MELFTKHKFLDASIVILALISVFMITVTLLEFRTIQNEQKLEVLLTSDLQKEEVIVVPQVDTTEYSAVDTSESSAVVTAENPAVDITEYSVVDTIKPVLFEYVEIVGSCGPYFDGECLNVRSGPGLKYAVVSKFRNNVVLRVGEKIERDGQFWYKIIFDEWIRYPERVTGDWYISAAYTRVFLHQGASSSSEQIATTTKQIVIERTKQMLYAYDGDVLYMQETISTGIELTPTPQGTFTIYKKTPSRYMQGPLPGISTKYWDLPGVPWNLYFSKDGAIIHGTYWHNKFGNPQSNGCVNMKPSAAEKLYMWADIGTQVIVRG